MLKEEEKISAKEVEGVECLSFYIEINKQLKLKNS
jgi:hypothetical protein